MATVDVLGEEITSPEEARAITQEYEDVLEEFERSALDSNVSVKLTALGLKLDPDLCRANLEEVVEYAAKRGNFVRIDMEDSTTTDATLELYRGLRASGRDNVGVVLQAALRRTVADVEALSRSRPERPPVQGHLCRAARDCVRGPGRRPRELRARARCAAGGRVLRRHRDPRRVARGRRAPAGARARARGGRVRVPDAARRSSRPRPRARARAAPAPHLRAVRTRLVRVLAPAAAGEPEDRGVRRRRHARPAEAAETARARAVELRGGGAPGGGPGGASSSTTTRGARGAPGSTTSRRT